jgi:hypothetical protein
MSLLRHSLSIDSFTLDEEAAALAAIPPRSGSLRSQWRAVVGDAAVGELEMVGSFDAPPIMKDVCVMRA